MEGGINLFTYVQNNPVNWVDRFGLEAGEDVIRWWPIVSPAIKSIVDIIIGGAAVVAGQFVIIVGIVSWPSTLSKDECEEEREKRCDNIYYKIDIPTCRAIGRKRGKEAAQRCYASAAQRHAACLRGQSMPPLDTWNN